MSIELLKFDFIKSNGEPRGNMTDSQWEKCFNQLRKMTRQSRHKNIVCRDDLNKYFSKLYNNQELSDPSLERYSQFINGILKSIRGGKEDYCFYVYQVADLLQFEHEHLKVRWMPAYKCFGVTLDGEVI